MAGQILKIKPGYNPNSSSVGSLYGDLLWVVSAGALLLSAFSTLRPPREVPPKKPAR